jgi:hypothetical protein
MAFSPLSSGPLTSPIQASSDPLHLLKSPKTDNSPFTIHYTQLVHSAHRSLDETSALTMSQNQSDLWPVRASRWPHACLPSGRPATRQATAPVSPGRQKVGIIQHVAACMALWPVLPSESSEKDECDLHNLTTDLRLRLLSTSKLALSPTGHGSRHAHIGSARKCSCEGMLVPDVGRE